MEIDYRVVIFTQCRECAMAIAGHMPKLGSIRSVVALALGQASEGGPLTIHSNTPFIKAHDGTAFRCARHGCVIDLSREP